MRSRSPSPAPSRSYTTTRAPPPAQHARECSQRLLSPPLLVYFALLLSTLLHAEATRCRFFPSTKVSPASEVAGGW